MKSLQLALVPGAIAALISIVVSWLLMAVIFHRFEEETPETWRPENKGSYAITALLRFLACIVIATLFLLVARNYGSVFGGGLERSLAFGVLIWMGMAAPLAVEAAAYIRIHPLVVLGQLLDWLATSLLACGIAGWWHAT